MLPKLKNIRISCGSCQNADAYSVCGRGREEPRFYVMPMLLGPGTTLNSNAMESIRWLAFFSRNDFTMKTKCVSITVDYFGTLKQICLSSNTS